MYFRATTEKHSLDLTDVRNMATGKASRMPVPQDYFEVIEPINFHLSTGIQNARIGDVVIVGDDHAWCVSRDYFDKFYQKLDE